MAVVVPTVKHIGKRDGATVSIEWTPLTTINASGTATQSDSIERSVQVNGTFGAGGTIAIQGSNDGTNFYPLTDPQGNPLSITSAKIERISEVTEFIRPVLTGGDGTTSLTITCVLRSNNTIRA